MGPLSDIENKRSKLLGSVSLLLAAFATVAVAFTLLGPELIAPLQDAPFAARFGVLLLTLGFIALVWERERKLNRLQATLTRQNLLIASFESRLGVVDALLDATDRLNVSLPVDDVLKVILDAAVELVGAETGSVELFHGEGDVAVNRSRALGGVVDSQGSRLVARFPLVLDEEELGALTLILPGEASGLDPEVREVAQRFAHQAARAVDKARALEKEQATVAHLEAANAAKARFLNSVSHELRTPLTSIIGFAATLDAQWGRLDEADRTDFVKEIRRQSDRLGTIVEQLLETARVELQGITIVPVVHDVRQSATDALTNLAGPGHRVRLRIPSEPALALVDPFVIDEVIFNLVDNAIRYTPGDVEVAIEDIGDAVLISVRDEGSGIEPLDLRLWTDPFYRGHDEGDTGKGLFLVRMLVESHGGRGTIKSDEYGTAVSVVIPKDPAASETSRVLDSSHAQFV